MSHFRFRNVTVTLPKNACLQFKSIRKIHKETLPKALPENKNLSPERNLFRKSLAKFRKEKFIRLINDVIIVMAERMGERCFILEKEGCGGEGEQPQKDEIPPREPVSASGRTSPTNEKLITDILQSENKNLKHENSLLNEKYQEAITMLAKAEALILSMREELDEKDLEIQRLKNELKTSEDERKLLQEKVTDLAQSLQSSRGVSRKNSKERLLDEGPTPSMCPRSGPVSASNTPPQRYSREGSPIVTPLQQEIRQNAVSTAFEQTKESLNSLQRKSTPTQPEMIGRGFTSQTGVKNTQNSFFPASLPQNDPNNRGTSRRTSLDVGKSSTFGRNSRNRSVERAKYKSGDSSTKSGSRLSEERPSYQAAQAAHSSARNPAVISSYNNQSTLIKEPRNNAKTLSLGSTAETVTSGPPSHHLSSLAGQPAESKITINVKATQASVQLAKLMSAYKSRNAQNIKLEMKNVSIEVTEFIKFFKKNINIEGNENCFKFLNDLEHSLEELAVNIFSKESSLLLKNDLFVKHCYSIANCMKKLVVEVENMPMCKILVE